MSDECGDKPSVPTLTRPSCPTHCFWFSQGQCFLNTLPEDHVYQIICTTPAARDAIGECVSLGCCEPPSQRILDFVAKEGTIRDSQDLADDFQRRINTPYRDNSPYIGPGVFRDPSGGED
jgi:hypothetical protein